MEEVGLGVVALVIRSELELEEVATFPLAPTWREGLLREEEEEEIAVLLAVLLAVPIAALLVPMIVVPFTLLVV